MTAAAVVALFAALSSYEAEEIAPSLREIGGVIDEAPEGKIVERVHVRALEVIEPRDPAPEFLNAIHATTRPYVIEREVLLRPGDPYRKSLADETARNLRDLRQLSLVVVVPVKGSTPRHVQLLVVVKDVWSLRPSLDFKVGPGGLERLWIEPLERNVAGTHTSVVARFSIEPKTFMLGTGYFVPRLAGTRLYFISEANAFLNRDQGGMEGSYGQVAVSRNLYSALTPWAFGFNVQWSDRVVRRYVNAQVADFDASETPEVDGIPDVYRARKVTEHLNAVRSFGFAHKLDLTFGLEMTLRAYRTEGLEGYDPAAVASFERARLPRSDNRAAPFFQVHAYESPLVRIYDADTLGLAEDLRPGYDLWLRAYPVTKALGSSRSFLGVYAGAAYTLRMGPEALGGFVRGSVESLTEGTAEQVDDGALAVGATLATPQFAWGRVVFDVQSLRRWRNGLNLRSMLGGNTRLRGYPSDALIGESVFASNLEFRARPLRIGTIQFGAVAFYDVGDAYDGMDIRPKHSIGGGLRIAIPAIDRKVVRFDIGFPVPESSRPYGVGPVGFFVGLEQAFPIARPAPPSNAVVGALSGQGAFIAPAPAEN